MSSLTIVTKALRIKETRRQDAWNYFLSGSAKVMLRPSIPAKGAGTEAKALDVPQSQFMNGLKDWEKLVATYEKVKKAKFDEYLKRGILMRKAPQELFLYFIVAFLRL